MSTEEDLIRFVEDLDDECIRPLPASNSSDDPPSANETSPCYDCGKIHHSRRIVCCVDGTWMGPDGVVSYENGRPSNVFRTWASIRNGVVEDEQGKKWQQVRKYFKGIGASLDLIPRLFAGVTGSGFEVLIFQVYKFCALNCCPSQDEVYLFGFSRGAYVVRAVAAIFHHMKTLDPKLPNFDEAYWESMKLYRRIRDKADLHQHELYHHVSEQTLPPISIKFVGVFDTVKAVRDSGMYDIQQTPNVQHVRHALALLERRTLFSPEKYSDSISQDSNTESYNQVASRSCIEAWFLGGHINLGGSLVEDGLSLWPLQWILSEAQKSGLILGFQPLASVEIPNPIAYTMPDDSDRQIIPFRNGLDIEMWDLRGQFEVGGMLPEVRIMDSKLGPRFEGPRKFDQIESERTRNVSELTTQPHSIRYDRIIHPSVFLHDDVEITGLLYINNLSERHKIRGFRKSIAMEWDEFFWNKEFRAEVNLSRRHTRVLACGANGIGKSALLARVSGSDQVLVNDTMTPTDHIINQEIRGSRSHFVFHDSCGWNNGSQVPYNVVQEFLNSRRKQPAFSEQLHCIWYCMNATQTRISEADKKFFETVDFKGITLVLVFTWTDSLRSLSTSQATEDVRAERGLPFPLDALDAPPDVVQDIRIKRDEIFEIRKQSIVQQVHNELGNKFDTVLVSKFDQDDSNRLQLVDLTNQALHQDLLIQIHNNAIASKLKEILPRACQYGASMKVGGTYELLFFLNDHHTQAEVEQSIAYNMETVLPSLFGFKLDPDALFRNMDDKFSKVNERRRETVEGRWTRYAFNTAGRSAVSISTSLGSIAASGFLAGGPIGAFAFGVAGGVVNYAQDRARDFHRIKFTLLEISLYILLHERLYWFGAKEISKGMAARAWIEVLKLLPDIEDKLQKLINVFLPDDWTAILTDVVKTFGRADNTKDE